MLPILLTLVGLSTDAAAASDIEFKTSGPVLIYVDGQQATLTSKLKQRLSGLDAGTHEIRVTGVFGKTLFEAEMDIPDGTLTYAEWGHGELKVVRTEWLDDNSNEEVDEVVADMEEEEEEPAEPIRVVAPEEPPAAPEPPLAVPAEPEAVAEAPEVEEEPPLPVAPPVAPEPPVEQALSLPPPAPTGRTLTVQAQDGMRIEVVHEGQSVIVVVEDGAFRIVDPNGLELALSGE